jgi:arylsulfatase B
MKTIFCFLASLLFSILNCKSQNNVILVILDDWGLDQMESFNLGSTYAITPTIDSLKMEGALFTNFTTYPVCSPTRAAMLTGKYGFRTNVGDVVDYGEADMDTSFMTIPKVLKNFGIPSAMIGKYHLGCYWV